MSLDQFLPSTAKPKPVEERCANPQCRKILTKDRYKGTKYDLTVKGKKATYCQECAKKILRPQENSGANL